MSFLSGITGAIGGILSPVTDLLGKGIRAGTSSFKPATYDYDPNAFNNPNLASDKSGYAQAIADAKARAGQSSPFKDAQTGLIGSYQNTINGTAPSVAQNQLRQGADRSLQNSYALALSGRGNPVANMRTAQLQNAQTNQATNSQAATLRAQEVANAQQGLAGVTNAGRAADLNDQSQLNQLTQYYTTLGYTEDQANQAAQQHLQELKGQEVLSNNQTAAGIANNNATVAGSNIKSLIGAGGQMLGAASLFSDKNLKENIDSKKGSKDLEDFMDAVKAYKYNYKDSKMGEGNHYSVMAQDLEKSPVGKAMVENTPQGKMVNYGRGFGAILAAQASLHERMKNLEGKKKSA